jgi:hypothetical protein
MKTLIDDIERNGERGASPLPARSAELTPDLERQAREAVR